MISKVLAISAIGALALTGCSQVQDSYGPGMMNEQFEVSDQQDLMFAVMMIPHHKQAVEMSELALGISDSSELTDLANQIIAGQTPEVELMKGWLDESEQFSEMPGIMESMPGMNGMMGGMATDEEMEDLADLSSPEFDQMFLELMIDHHEGALDMVQMIIDSDNPEVKTLADDIVRVQTSEIQKMERMLEDYS